MNRRRRDVLAVALALVMVGAVIALPVAGQSETQGQPDFSVHLPDNEVVPGSDVELQVQLLNDGEVQRGMERDRVTTARGVTVEVDDDGPFDARTGSSAIGAVSDGGMETVPIRLHVPDDVEPGTYDIDLRIRFSHANFVSDITGVHQELQRTQTRSVTVRVVSEPRFAITDVDTQLQSGTTDEVRLTVENIGTETAHDIRSTLSGSDGATIGDGSLDTHLGDLDPGDNASVAVDMTVSDAIRDGHVPINAVFTFVDDSGIERESRTVTARVESGSPQSFDISSLDAELAIGDGGDIHGTIENVGPRFVDDAVLVIESTSEAMRFSETRYALPELYPGELSAFRFPVEISGAADEGPRQVRFFVEYGGTRGDPARIGPESERIEIAPGPAFAIENLSDTLAVGYDGEIRGTLRNEGDRAIGDSVLTIEPATDSLFIEEGRYALPELGPGEATEFVFPTDVSGQAQAGPRQVRFFVEWGQDRDEPARSGTLSQRVVVDERAAEFSVTHLETTVAAGGTADVRLELTNERPETLRNIDARIYTSGPLSASHDEAFVNELEPGESAVVVFRVSVDGGAMATTYPVELDFQYDTSRGDTVLSRTYQEPITVTEAPDDSGGLPTWGVVLGITMLIAGGGAIWWKRHDILE